MSLPRSVAEILKQHVTLEVEGIDRMGTIRCQFIIIRGQFGVGTIRCQFVIRGDNSVSVRH